MEFKLHPHMTPSLFTLCPGSDFRLSSSRRLPRSGWKMTPLWLSHVSGHLSSTEDICSSFALMTSAYGPNTATFLAAWQSHLLSCLLPLRFLWHQPAQFTVSLKLQRTCVELFECLTDASFPKLEVRRSILHHHLGTGESQPRASRYARKSSTLQKPNTWKPSRASDPASHCPCPDKSQALSPQGNP